MIVRCWGTRGSIPSPGPATAGYGGNTPCLEVEAGGRRLIFDAGSGMRLLGLDLLQREELQPSSIFLTHFHWDHIQGFPFFGPLYHPEASLHIVGPQQDGIDIRSLFAGQMGPIYFPVPFSAVAASLSFDHLDARPPGEISWEEGDVRLRALRMRHPSVTVGYRIEHGGRSVCYVPDNELAGGAYPVEAGSRDRLVDFVGDCDLLLHDAMYDDDEYDAKVGWGHSTFAQTVELAAEAGVGRLLFFHHAPERTDSDLDGVVGGIAEARDGKGGPEIGAAREGRSLQV